MAAASATTRVQDAINEHLDSSKSRGAARATLTSKRVSLDKLILVTGNILMKNVGPGHVDQAFAQMQADGLRPSTINLHRTNMTTFFKWCQSRRYLLSTVSPMEGTRKLKSIPRERLWVPASKFPHLLDCASHPRNRMIVALGLYLFLRQSEIKKLTVQDVNLEDGFVSAIIYKTKQRDEMPISKQLDRELRRYLTWYSGQMDAPLSRGWYLLPARSAARFTGTREGLKRVQAPEVLSPHVHLNRLEGIAQETLSAAGYVLRDDEGVSLQEGMHTLRRSGARARYDYLVDVQGYDGALRQVQAMLHHTTTAMTENYLGLTLDVKKRNESIRGQDMFGEDDSSTVTYLQDRQVN